MRTGRTNFDDVIASDEDVLIVPRLSAHAIDERSCPPDYYRLRFLRVVEI